MTHQGLLEPGSTVNLIRDEQKPVSVDRKSSQVEDLVVQDTQGQSVALMVRAPGLMPADVGRIQGDGHGAEPYVETADRTAVFVRCQDPLTETRVSLLPCDLSPPDRQAACC